MSIDWNAVHAEALDIFVRYLQIDTSNPPGREKPAARFLGALLENDGIPCEYIETAPDREILVARLRGDGSRRPLMLCNHTDVVPVEAQYWDVPPFDGLVKDGRVYGRGAVDMKGCGVMQLIATLLLKRQGIPLRRNLVFCAVPDEEAGSGLGMGWLCEHRPDVVDVEFELSEGAMGRDRFGHKETRLFSIATNEKAACPVQLTAVGRPGHGSIPARDNSMVHLARALVRLADWDRGVTFTPDTRAFLARLSEAGLVPPLSDDSEAANVVSAVPELQPMFMNTLNITVVTSGIKVNVVPAKSTALLDCRLLPGQRRDDWLRQIRERIDDPRIAVETVRPTIFEPTPANWDTELFRVIQSVLTEAIEDAVVVPSMTVGATDNRFLRARGVAAYGFIPCLLSNEEARGFHGNNEFLTIENLNMGCELMYEVVRRMCS